MAVYLLFDLIMSLLIFTAAFHTLCISSLDVTDVQTSYNSRHTMQTYALTLTYHCPRREGILQLLDNALSTR